MKNKMYTNAPRRPMMAGGKATTQKKRVRKSQGDTAVRPSEMTAEKREALVRRKGQLEAALKKGGFSEEVTREMRMTLTQIEDQLGTSPTPGRAPVDAPEPKMYGGMTGAKKMAMGGKTTKGRSKMMAGGKATKGRSKMAAGGKMPMTMKDGKKVPAFAADGKGKMAKGGKTTKGRSKMMMGGTRTKGYAKGGRTGKK